ncbi:MAG TPA: UDP-N-acetylmuramate--L-alanine ligase [Chthonomonadales bacterium]|nr:UDP-N-acetylmuramate--L-alanine ligase [Chthonomonadales bacterium]
MSGAVCASQWRRVHFVGIGGASMSGIARALLARGIDVSGCDPQRNAATDRLEALGARIRAGQDPSHIALERPDALIVTAAVPMSSPEVTAALNAGIEVLTRAEVLGWLMDEAPEPRIGVTGTHGKTTTTAMLAAVLMTAGLDPAVHIGGEYAPLGGNVRIGKGCFLTEACEAYDSFLSLRPTLAVVTNIEADHLDYYGTPERMFESFEQFVASVPEGGAVVLCADDPGARRLATFAAALDRRTVLYGIDATDCDVRGADLASCGRGVRFRAITPEEPGGVSVSLRVPGRHNALNALASIAAAREAGVPLPTAIAALEQFEGTGRRFERLGEASGADVYDDYAHHPTEIAATVRAVRQAFPGTRFLLLFQPHLFSRTRDFLNEFADALAAADIVLVSDIYPAREAPIPGITSATLVKAIAQRSPDRHVLYAPSQDEALAALRWLMRPGDLVMTMGAGDIRSVGEALVDDHGDAPAAGG